MNLWTTSGGQTVYQIAGGRCNGFLLAANGNYLLVDCGSKIQWKRLRERLNRAITGGKTLIALILTHCHFDHAENAARVKENFKTPIVVQANEADYLQKGQNPLLQGSNPATGLLTRLFLNERVLEWIKYPPVAYDILVEERYDLGHWGFKGYIIHTPGHSPGSMSVILEDEIALVGDAMYGVFKNSVFPPYTADGPQTVKSWQKLLETGCSVYLPAHGWARSRELVQQQYQRYQKIYHL